MAKNRLGKGMSALLPDIHDEAVETNKTQSFDAAIKSSETSIPLEKLRANPGQPRKRFNKEELEELSASIKQHGVIQPIIVDKNEDGSFIIIAGERRSRAAALAGLKEIPALIRNYSDQKRLEVAIIENLHRSDLNPIEEAYAYKQLMETAGLTQDEAAERVGKNRSTVTNALRLLKLPVHVRDALEEGTLSAGHARAILSLSKNSDQEALFQEIQKKGLSVREAEKLAADIADGKAEAKNGKGDNKGQTKNVDIKRIEEHFIQNLGTKVTIHGTLKKGRIEIEYYSMDDLERLYELLKKK